VLYAVGELRAEMIRPPSTDINHKIEENSRFNPYFKVIYFEALETVILIRAMNNPYFYFPI
jgi:hypothetical protein